MTIQYNNATGDYTAREGQDFVVAPTAQAAAGKLRKFLEKSPATHATWVRRRSIRDQSLASRFIQRKS